jgi:MraZ protein
MQDSNAPAFKPLIGTDEANIDAKGRLLIREKKRLRLGKTFVMAYAETGCIAVYPEDTWQSVVAELMAGSVRERQARPENRLVFGSAEDDLAFDTEGRVMIPRRLREQAKIGKSVIVLGCGDYLEIWDPVQYGVHERLQEAKRLAAEMNAGGQA